MREHRDIRRNRDARTRRRSSSLGDKTRVLKGGGGEYGDPGLGRRRKIAYEDLRETLYNRDADS